MLNSSSPCFYDVFSSNFSSDKLKIPSNFIKHMDGQKSGSVWLAGPSGCIWHVDLIQQDGDLFFDSGWKVFIEDNGVVSNDLLVFTYDGDFHFTVQVFDQSRCEKESAFHAICSQVPSNFNKYAGQKRERDKVTVASLDSFFDGVPKKSRGSYHECVHDDDDNCQHKVATLSQLMSCNDKTESSILKRLDDCLSTFSEHEEKKIAKSFTSCFPFFVRKMKRFNINGSYTLNVPYKFSMAHLPKCKTEIILHNMKGACWTVNSVPTIRVHTSHTFCGGWLSFVRDNDIEIGDICIFELVQKCELRVHILRVGKEEPESQNAKVSSNKLFEGKSKKMATNSPKVHSKGMAKVLTNIVSKKNLKSSSSANLSTQSRASNGKQVLNRNSCRQMWAQRFWTCCAYVVQNVGTDRMEKLDRQYNSLIKLRLFLCKTEVASQRRNNVEADGMKMMLARDEKKAAKSFISSFPNFVRIMRKFNTSGSYTLKVPHRFSKAYLPNCRTEIILHNTRGESWSVNSVPDSKGRVAHTFCGGWMAFVRDNNIRMGDICMFELVSQSEMRVQISGPGRKTLDNQLSGSSTSVKPLLVGT